MIKETLAAVIGVALLATTADRGRESKKQPLAYLMPPADIKRFTFGYHESIADSFWIRVIQDFDLCEQAKLGQKLVIEERPGFKPDLPPECSKGWVFHMVDSITELAPRFRIAYVAGGIMLSTVVHDHEGAAVIFTKGSVQFPKNWQIYYYNAYHHLLNLGQTEKAAELMILAGRNGAPPWTFSLAAKLYTEAGKAFLAKTVIESVLRDYPDEYRWIPRLKQRLDEANAVLKKSGSPLEN